MPDSLQATRDTLRAAAAGHDLIITSGGVSVGEEDHIKPAVEAEGRLNMWQIAVKPGKPLAFGEVQPAAAAAAPSSSACRATRCRASSPSCCSCGPSSARLAGMADAPPAGFMLRADFAWPKADRRNEFLRARINAAGGLDLFPNQGSGVLTSTVWGDGLIDNPPGQTIAPGDLVRFIPFNQLLYLS